ncbi:MAG: PRC-barrel domain-containing protein [Maricaulaceae bacterium]
MRTLKTTLIAVSSLAGVAVAIGSMPAAAFGDKEVKAQAASTLVIGPNQFSAEEFVGETVYAANGSMLGEVNDVWIDASGQAQSLLVKSGGLAGLGGDVYVIDFSSDLIQLKNEDEAVVTTLLTEDILDGFPIYDPSAHSELHLASEILGSEVEFADSPDEAQIVDLVMSLDGTVDWAVLSDGIVFGLGGEHRAVKMNQLIVADTNGKYRIDMTPDELRDQGKLVIN